MSKYEDSWNFLGFSENLNFKEKYWYRFSILSGDKISSKRITVLWSIGKMTQKLYHEMTRQDFFFLASKHAFERKKSYSEFVDKKCQ